MMEAIVIFGVIVFFAFLAWLADKLEEIGTRCDK